MELKVPNPFPYKLISQRDDDDTYGTIKYVLYEYTVEAKKTRNGHETGEIDVYTIRVEEFDYNVCAIKFYREKDRSIGGEYKYRVRTNVGHTCALRILATCITIALSLLEENAFRSFAFYGIGENAKDQVETKKYRIYLQYVKNYISIENFQFEAIPDRSYLLLLNKNNTDQDLLLKIERALLEIFLL